MNDSHILTFRQYSIVAYLDSVQARLAAVREVQSATGEELSALLPSVLDKSNLDKENIIRTI